VKDFYTVLGVHPEASPKEIKSAFRKTAKARHPDTGAKDEEAMRLILEAYKTLADAQSRREYDRGRLRLVPHGEGSAFDYREWLKERLVLQVEALQLYERIRDTDDGRLERFFERPEAMDAEFCIAEEYAERGRFVDAYRVMRKLIAMEQRGSGFGYFYDVVLSRFRRLVLEDLPKALEPEAFLEKLEDAVSARSSAENDAQFLRRRAEILFRLGRSAEARSAVAKAASLAPRMPGLKALALKMASGRKREA